MWRYKVLFQEKLQNSWFLYRFVAEIISRKKLNRRVLYYGGEVEDLSLKAIQTLSYSYPLSPDYPIRKDFSDILSLKYLWRVTTSFFISQNVDSLRSNVQKMNLGIIIYIMAKKKIDAYCIKFGFMDFW